MLVAFALALLVGCDTPRPARNANTEKTQPTASTLPAGLLPEIAQFLDEHKEFGKPTRIEAMPDWAKGKRQRVVLELNESRRNLLFYMKENKVITVYEDDGSRKIVWGKTE